VKQTRVIGLSVGYRIPGQIMELANKVMEAASPGLRAPTAVREGAAPPLIVDVSSRVGVGFDGLANEVIAQTRSLSEVLDGGNVAVVVPDALAEDMSVAFTSAGVTHGRAVASALDTGVTIVPVSVVKGLELDGVIVVEPATIVDSEPQGMRSLYVALTRATQRLVVVHARPLPEPMRHTPTA